MSEKPLRAITWSKGGPAASRHRVGDRTRRECTGDAGRAGREGGRKRAQSVRGAPLGGSRDAARAVVAPERRLSRKKRGGRQTPFVGTGPIRRRGVCPHATRRARGKVEERAGERDTPIRYGEFGQRGV